ncbi:Butyryl-CoA dehydrogenase [Geobacillus sp. B4113_201601]|nr:Butyryl-CoA dehydrogenase [Geobacillus sp. B4113_201601]
MHLRLTDEQRMVQKAIRKFVEKELIPLENEVLRNEREGKPGLAPEKLKELQFKAKERAAIQGEGSGEMARVEHGVYARSRGGQPPFGFDGEAVWRQHGQSRHRPRHTNSQRHGLYERAVDRALVS